MSDLYALRKAYDCQSFSSIIIYQPAFLTRKQHTQKPRGSVYQRLLTLECEKDTVSFRKMKKEMWREVFNESRNRTTRN